MMQLMGARRIVALIGSCVLLVSLVIGLIPVHRHGVSCGGALHKSGAAGSAELYNAIVADASDQALRPGEVGQIEDDCDSLRSIVKIPTFALGAVGLVLLGVAISMQPPTRIVRSRA